MHSLRWLIQSMGGLLTPSPHSGVVWLGWPSYQLISSLHETSSSDC